MVEVERRKPTREYVKEEYQSVVSVKSEYAVYDPVKDEETEEEEGDDLLEDDGKLSIKNEDDDVKNVKADDHDTDDECCLGKLYIKCV